MSDLKMTCWRGTGSEPAWIEGRAGRCEHAGRPHSGIGVSEPGGQGSADIVKGTVCGMGGGYDLVNVL